MKISEDWSLVTNGKSGLYIPEITRIDHEMQTMLTLRSPSAEAGKRYGCVRTLKHYGCSAERTFEIIDGFNIWANYDKNETWRQIGKSYKVGNHSVYVGPDKPSNFMLINSGPPTHSIPDLLTSLEKYIIPRIVFPKKSDFLTAHEYNRACAFVWLRNGFHPLPKSPKGKFQLISSWKAYQDRAPTYEEMMSWNWNYGVCLILNDNTACIDIDVKDGKEGMKWIQPHSKIMMNGNMWETSQSGGIHIFLKGFRIALDKRYKSEGVEIIGKGGLVVVHPTENYCLSINHIDNGIGVIMP